MPDESARRVVVADDSPTITLMLAQTLRQDGHHVTVAHDGQEALTQITATVPDLILLDLDMPRLSGYEVCHCVKSNPATRLIPIVIITGQSAAEARLRAWELGADDFLTKPFQCVDILARSRSLLRVKRLVDELDSATEVVFALARAVEAKSPYTQGHAGRVTALALELAVEIGLPESERATLRKGALLHDIGKISIPDSLLDKPSALTAEEYEIIKSHPVRGAHIVEPLRSIRDAVPLIRWHHERLDGRGYPDGLRGDQIPRTVRVLSVVDTYDAMASNRPYRDAIPHARCLDLLRASAAEGGLDPELVKAFCLAHSVSGPPRAVPGPAGRGPSEGADPVPGGASPSAAPELSQFVMSHDLT